MSPHEIDDKLRDPIDQWNVGRFVEAATGNQDQIRSVSRSRVEKCPNRSIDHSRRTPRNLQTLVPGLRFGILILQIKFNVSANVRNETRQDDIGELVGANASRGESLTRHVVRSTSSSSSSDRRARTLLTLSLWEKNERHREKKKSKLKSWLQ